MINRTGAAAKGAFVILTEASKASAAKDPGLLGAREGGTGFEVAASLSSAHEMGDK